VKVETQRVKEVEAEEGPGRNEREERGNMRRK
jgi:hypothetical protein